MPRSRKRRVRLTLLLGPLVFLFLFLIVGGRVTRQQLDVEGNVQRRIIPQLEKELGVDIEIGRIESDYFSRVVLHDVVVGRNPKLPIGALLRAKTVYVNLDLIGLVQHRDDPLSALRSILIDAPQAYVQRDARGRLNWEKLFSRRPAGPASVWTGSVTLRAGRVWYEDEGIRNGRGQILVADATGANASARFYGADPTSLKLSIARTFIGAARVPIDNIYVAGNVSAATATNPAWLALDAQWPSAPVALLAEYAAPREAQIQGGTVGGKVQLAFDAGQPSALQWVANGNLALRNVSGRARAVLDPTTHKPLQIVNANGPVAFNNLAFSTTGLTLSAMGSPLRIAGTAALQKNPNKPDAPGLFDATSTVFDLRAESASLDTNRLAMLLPRGTVFSGGRSRATSRISGNLQAMRISSVINTPQFSFRHAQGNLRGTLLKSTVDFAGNLQSGRAVTKFEIPGFNGGASGAGSFAGKGLSGTLRLAGDLSGATTRGKAIAQFSVAGFSAAGAPGAGNLVGKGLNGTLQLTGNLSDAGTRGNGVAQFSADNFSSTSSAFGQARGRLNSGIVRFATNGTRSPLSADVSISDFAARSSRTTRPQYGAARGQSLRLVVATPDFLRSAWSGATYAGGIDPSGINIAALSPDAARQIREAGLRDLGLAEGSVRFAGIGPNLQFRPAQTRLSGAFRLSRAQLQSIALRDISGRFALAGGQWSLADARAGSDFGNFSASLDSQNSGVLSLSAPRVVIGAEQLNPYLAPAGIAVTGDAIGRLQVQGGGASPIRASFNLSLPRSVVRTRATARLASRNVMTLANSTLRGAGTIALGARGTWTFQGSSALYATRATLPAGGLGALRIGGMALPAWLEGSSGQNVRIAASGRVVRTSTGIVPRLQGDIRFARADWPVPASAFRTVSSGATRPALSLGDGRVAFSLGPDGVQLPRITARPLGLSAGAKNRPASLSAHFTTRNGAGPNRAALVGGQILAERIDAAAMQKMLGALIPNASTMPRVSGLAYARIDVTGTLADPRAEVQARLLDGAVTVDGRRVPVDAARADLSFAGTSFSTIPVRELTLWSRGGRLRLNGEATRVTKYNGKTPESGYTLNFDAVANDFRVRDALVLAMASPASAPSAKPSDLI
ncbi:MAG TPA: hypothetical protein VF719_04760, partial [Abditibacteriaceae bacterium]